MTTGEQGRTPPDAEHYLDLSGIEEDSPGPHFDVVLRGYDRRQVDEHVAGLRRMNAQLRAQLAVRERRRAGATSAQALEGALSDTMPEARRSSAPDEGAAGSPDMVGAFNDRLRGILQAAEQEAQLVRSKAAESLLAEHAESRAALAELRAQRDAVVDELVRLRGRLDEIVSGPARPSGSPQAPPGPPRPGAPWRGPGRPPGPPPFPGPRPPGPYGGPPSAPVPMGPPAGPERHEGGNDASVEDTVAVDATPAEVADADATDDGVAVGGEGAGIDPAADVTDGALPTPSTSGRAADG
ncbi:MAG: hypothetical protein K0S40_35 [Actinomycetospora sp.]|jgi:syndecan 1|nr:hypothetical protein [Actinomycetospora sp.]